MDERRTRLVALVQDLAFLDGGHHEAFTLASGRTSQWFFDMKPVMMHPEAGGLVADLILDHVEALGVDLLGGLELGAVPLTALVIARAGEMSALRGIMIRKEAKGRGGRKTQNPPGFEGASIAGDERVLILEDVTTTGGSALQVVERIRQQTTCEIVGVLTILDREEGASEAFGSAGIPFIPLLTRTMITT